MNEATDPPTPRRSDISNIAIWPILSSAPNILIGDQDQHYLAYVDFGRLVILFWRVFRVKHCMNYVIRVNIHFNAYTDLLG